MGRGGGPQIVFVAYLRWQPDWAGALVGTHDFLRGCHFCPHLADVRRMMLPCVDNIKCQHATPSLGNINFHCLLLAVRKSPAQEIVIMEDYLKDTWPIYSSPWSGFLSLDQAIQSENCVSGPNAELLGEED